MIKHVGLMSMKQKMEKMISTLRERAKRTGIIRKTVGLGLALMMVIETPSWSGLIRSALAHEDKVGSGRCIYVDTSLIGADSDVMESGIGAYVYNRDGGSYSDAPIIMEKVEGKRNVYQLVLDDYYTYVEFTKGSDLNTGTKTGALAIDWSLGSPCYMFNSEALSDGGHFYGLYTVYFDLNGAPDASAFADNGVGVYAYNSDEDSYTAVPVAMKASGKGDNVYEYSLDGPYDCIAFMGGYGSWNYEVATAPVYMDWSYSAPCFFLEQVDGHESTGVWRNLRYTVYFDASDIKDDEAFIENGVWLYAFNDSDDKLSEDPVKMVASSVGSYIYEYTMERPYENLQFVLGDSLEAEVSSQVLVNDWMTYAEPCYKMTLDRKEILMASPSPSMTPSASPSGSPSPSVTPSMDPSASPSGSPSATPSTSPSADPSASPSGSPSATPSMKPSTSPDVTPSATPSANPTATPSANPTEAPTTEPTEIPTIEPTEEPTTEPTSEPTQEPEPAGEATPEPVEEATPEPVQDSEEDQQDTTSDDSSSDEQSQTLDQARAAAELTVTYGSYKMIWVGTEGGEDIEPITNTIESEESGDTDEEEPSTPENPPTVDESTDSETTTDTEEPEAPDTPADDSDENPTPAPTTGGEEDGEPMPSDNPDMISASPSTTPIGTDDGSAVETTMSLLSSTGATLMFQSAGVLPMREGGEVKTIYFDTVQNKDWTGKWETTDQNMYIFLSYASGGGSGIVPMQKSQRDNKYALSSSGDMSKRVIWEYRIPEEHIGDVIGAGFLPISSWDVAEAGTRWNQTITIDFTSGNYGSYPCFSVSTETEYDAGDGVNKRKVRFWGDLGPESQGGNAIYFFDMTSQLEDEETPVYAKFSGDEKLMEFRIERDSVEGGCIKFTIPENVLTNITDEEYSKVAFYIETKDGKEIQLGDTYNFFNKTTDDVKGFPYDIDDMNTFYYGTTEKTDGTKISTWGARPSEEIVSLAGKKLYFDRLYFQVPKDTNANGGASGGTGTGNTSGTGTLGAQFQIGTETPVSLIADEGDARTYSYTFDGASTATSQSILTYLDQDGTKYHFFWDKFTVESTGEDNDLVTQEYEIAKVMGKYELGNWIYYDATMSKMPNESANSYIPLEDGVVYCLMAKGSSGQEAVTLPMTKVEDRETWKDVWKIDLPEGYTYVKFANYEIKTSDGEYANGTNYQKVPTNILDPCFYADSGDDEIYGNHWRGGYWDEVYTIRDPEEIKDTPVVDIRQEDYTRNSKRLYVKTTLYDYYSDYELNGNNRDNLSGFENMSARDWVPFRELNQALSEYYEEAGEPIPLYIGHFQPNGQGGAFSGIADKLDLYGYGNDNRFFSTNNSQMDINGVVIDNEAGYARVAQGFVASELINDQVYASGNQVALPYFNEDFLAGNNSKNAVLGKIYEDVSFPFELMENYRSDEPGVSYWVYDSDKKSLEMRQTSDGEYYLYEDEKESLKWWSKNRISTGAEKTSYGFFPFNAGSLNGARSYNYGYGAKLEINFRLTPDGTVETKDSTVPIKFDFSGDDDVWVFIDGHLALDMGGAHGAAHGVLDFASREYKIDSVKASAGSSGSTSGSFMIDGFDGENYDTREHTLTMFYMERGMWESNMKISFNFPDENQLEVEKRVNTDQVNELFKSAFDGHKIFEFSVRNLATHFGPKTVSSDGDTAAVPISFNPDFSGVKASWSTNTFNHVEAYEGHTNVAYWLAKESDASSSWRDRRYGIIPSTDGAVNATEMKYLQFSYYYAGNGYPNLYNMYLQINTTAGSVTHRLSGKIYGSADMKRGEWRTLTVDLDQFFTGSSVNRAGITEIRFGYDYSEPFYLDDFVFKPGASSQKLTGFITKQPDIPDYGTSTTAKLAIPVGAVYTRKLEGVDDSYGRIDSDGTFALENGETVLFRDQFRRGSYIELKELLDSPVFTTTWTMYENGQPVEKMSTSGKGLVDVSDTGRSLKNQSSDQNAVDDGRTERYTNENKDGQPQGNSYDGTRPAEPVFVFRSYSDPDTDAGVTKLKVVYTNTVNVGNLVITKSQAVGSQDLNAEYPFRVTFTNIAGMGLEGDAPIVVEFKLKKGGVYEIKGIPLLTSYVIEELEPADKSFLAEVKGSGTVDFDSETKQVRGTIENVGSTVSYDFSNMLKPVISVEVTKVWKNADGSEITEDIDNLEDSDLPEFLTIRIQRRVKGSNNAWEEVEKYKEDIKLGSGYERSWKYTFSELEKYVDNTNKNAGMYEYRVVEVDNQGKIVENGGFWGEFQARYENQIISGKNEDIPGEDELYTSTITNIHNVSLKVKKVDASGQPLGGVSFQLQRKDNEGNWKPVEVTVNNTKVDTITTPTKEENPVGGAGVIIFANLPSGEYQLIETATAPGHTLLANPISITINANGDFKYTINGIEQTPVDNTVELTIKNGQNLVMPATGGAGPIPFTVGGLSICIIASLMYIDSMRKRRKEGKAS